MTLMSFKSEAVLHFKNQRFKLNGKKPRRKQKHTWRRNKAATGKDRQVEKKTESGKEQGGEGGQIREHFTL